MPTLLVLCSPAGAGPTSRLVERCQHVPFGSALWIGPDHEALQTIRRHWSSPVLPRLLTFAELSAEIVRCHEPQTRLIGESERRWLLGLLIDELHQAGELSHFADVAATRGFADGVADWIANLKAAEIGPAAFARAGYRQGYRGTDVGHRIGRRSIRRKDRQLAQLYARYQLRLRQENCDDAEGQVWRARDLLARGCRAPFATIRAVFVDGFSRFSRTQLDMLQALARWVDEVWITLPDDAHDERGELFASSRRTRARLAAGDFTLAESGAGTSSRPAGIAHLERQLFRPLRTITRSADAGGIVCIEAPGQLGEVRLVARRIKSLLLAGVPAGDLVVAVRDLQAYADRIDEVFAEYGIPIELEGEEPLARNPAVATLLRAWRLAEEGWPFAGVAALLRSTYLQPTWPEAAPDRALRGEALLRLLSEPAGREAYLGAVQRWAEAPPLPPDEDEGHPSRRQALQALALQCQPFLQRFFHAWDGQPESASWTEHVAWLRALASELGIDRAASARDQLALTTFFRELQARTVTGSIDRATVGRRLSLLSQSVGLPRSPRGPGRVRVLSAQRTLGANADYLFLMGLSEGSFPDLTPPDPILDETERRALQLASLAERSSEEMLLFHQLVTRPRKRLTLSYPAVDERGQDLLPSSFLAALHDCFQEGALETIRRRLLIEGDGPGAPLSPAELRVHTARLATQHGEYPAPLRGAASLVEHRLRRTDYSEFDGLLRAAPIRAELMKKFGPERTISPTALEDYVACPFRFFMRHVLGLAPLAEPDSWLLYAGRGLLVHRALARLHRRRQESGAAGPDDRLLDQLQARLGEVVEEHVGQAGSPALRELWRLEGLRLQRWLARYPDHWSRFLGPWRERAVAPRPHAFEIPFGSQGVPPLQIDRDGVSVRLGGRIDRLDVAEIEDELGYWIIDYKTGSSQHRRGRNDWTHLQLPIYALAVEEVVLKDQPARPLGLAYWMIAGSGCKLTLPARPADWLQDRQHWPKLRRQLQEWIATLARHIRQGDFPLQPRSEQSCAMCDFTQVCRISQSRFAVEKKSWSLPLPTVE